MRMRFAVIFEEGPEIVPVRANCEPTHLDYLEKYRDEIVMAGSLRNEHDGPFVGGI
jgi:uncharacterized protein YciI